MALEVRRALREQHLRFGPRHHRHQHGGGLGRLDAGLFPKLRLEVEVAADANLGVEVGQAGRHVAIEPHPCPLEELVRRRLDLIERHTRLHHANSLKLSAGAMAKNSPPETTPNIASPSTLRSSP